MDKESIKQKLISMYFPKLRDDAKFDITSPQDPNYNCIAWAYRLDKTKWIATPRGAVHLDGVVNWWPEDVPDGNDISCLVEVFEKIGYVHCDTWEHEKGFQKIALYWHEGNHQWTHASREGRQGVFWLSKLGKSCDIHHGDPYTVECIKYGTVYCIMKRPA